MEKQYTYWLPDENGEKEECITSNMALAKADWEFGCRIRIEAVYIELVRKET